MARYRLNILFSGVNFDDEATFEALAELDAEWRSQGDVALVSAAVEAPSAVMAATKLVHGVLRLVPSAWPLGVDEDLVAIPDIAERVGVTREAVRNWANGARHCNFPRPKGIVGDGIRVWAWGQINQWLNEMLQLGDPELFPSAMDIALIDSEFSFFMVVWRATQHDLADAETRPLARESFHVTSAPQPAQDAWTKQAMTPVGEIEFHMAQPLGSECAV